MSYQFKLYYQGLLENNMLKFENIVKSMTSPFSQQSSQDVIRNSMYIFIMKNLLLIQESFYTPN